ncbi:GntR family transcriptional regulator [Nocardia niigatensis]
MTLPEQIAEFLKREILPEYAPGDQLPVLWEMKERFPASTASWVRGYNLLVEEGLVNGQHGVGYFLVRQPGSEPSADDLKRAKVIGLLTQLKTTITDLDAAVRDLLVPAQTSAQS